MKAPSQTPAEPVVYVPSAVTTLQQRQALDPTVITQTDVRPPGSTRVYDPGLGEWRWAYTVQRPDAAPAPTRVPSQPLPRWVKSAAVLMPTTCASLALLSLAVPGLQAATALMRAIAAATGTLGLVGGGAYALFRFARPSHGAGGDEITATATATSKSLLGGKAVARASITVRK
ncbi:hypothetical protein ABZ569_32355 [Streptomyces albus]|uniref:hypothetical protein n=1 Tax=Streptomyces albus TaxID=1888 RepID=UPI0033C9EBAF